MSGGPVLVTGGGRGIGRAIVEALVGAGARVAFTWHSDRASAEALEAALGGAARSFPLDLADPRAPDSVVSAVEEALGPLEGLVNNAGRRREGLLAMTSDADWRDVLATNLDGAFRCCRAVLPGMVARRSGAIVNVASLSAFHGVAGETAYAASKAGLLGMTRALAREVGRRGIRVNAVAPGFLTTEMTAGLPDAAVARLRATECLPGGVDLRSVAGAVVFLLSPAAASITGQCLVVDAGASA